MIYVLGIKEKDVEILSIPLKQAIIPIQLMSKELEFDQVERYVSKLKNIVKIMLSDSAQKTVIAVTGHDFYENIKLGKEDAVTFGSINDVLEDLKVKVAADAKAEGITEPFEVIKRGNRYLLKSNPITFIAARCLRYKTVPCLIRNPRYELILHRTLRNLDID